MHRHIESSAKTNQGGRAGSTNGRASSRAQRETGRCGKLNIGALGNIVRQFHVHVVARNEGDDAWPGPVWGSGKAAPYPPDERERLLRALRAALVA